MPAVGRNPLEIYLLALCVISGAANLIAPAAPLPAHIPAVVAYAWYWLLIAGGGVALAGAWWRDPLTGALVNRAGLVMIGFGAYAYAVAVGRPLTGRALLGAAILVAFGLAAHWRAHQIRHWLKPLKGRRRAVG